MKYYGKAEKVLKEIIKSFEKGDVPEILAQIFVHRKDNIPCRSWSFANQFIMAIHGYTDARGFRQWEKVGRKVKKGEKSFYILGPCFIKVENDEGEEEKCLIGFRSIPVFGYEQTDGEELPKLKASKWIDDLPLIEVARKWKLKVTTFNGAGGRYLGYYKFNQLIALGVKNLKVWAHELMHAADGKINKGLKGGQDKEQEIVADVGGATLLTCLGLKHDADLGGVWKYINSYSKNPTGDCYKLLNRICKAVDLVLTTAEETTITGRKAA